MLFSFKSTNPWVRTWQTRPEPANRRSVTQFFLICPRIAWMPLTLSRGVQPSFKHSMTAERNVKAEEPKVSMRGGGLIADWYGSLHSPSDDPCNPIRVLRSAAWAMILNGQCWLSLRHYLASPPSSVLSAARNAVNAVARPDISCSLQSRSMLAGRTCILGGDGRIRRRGHGARGLLDTLEGWCRR